MSSHKYVKPLVLEPGNSKQLFFLLLLIHALAIVAMLMPMQLPVTGKAAIIFLILLSARSAIYKKNYMEIKQAIWKFDNTFDIELITSEQTECKLSSGTLVTEWLVILHLHCTDDKKRYWVIVRDMLDDETYRKLCVRLRQFHFTDI
ncbi:MAG: hypothetical protein OQK73_13060 [Gammaproteobacteria bacterium]|nr:hypothetical protein [Gammaproteobacteria bacterium]